jgi:Leucine-rich repeat (LRR) protein
VTPTFTPHAVIFADTALESKVRDTLGQPTGTLLSSDVSAITTLNAFSSGITDLTGIEECKGLVILSLYGNSISDISALSGLTGLNYLDLNMNQIADITALIVDSDSGGFPAGSQIILNNNPLSSQALNTGIPYLQSKSITVSW